MAIFKSSRTVFCLVYANLGCLLHQIMDNCVFLRLFFSCLFGVSCPLPRQYYFVNMGKTWLEAQSYCRAKYSDLATVNSMEEMKKLITEVDPAYIGAVWIGLKRGTQRHWGWSRGEDTLSQYSNWAADTNEYNQDEVCASKYRYGGWIPTNCTTKYQFVCYNDEQDTFHHISLYATWTEAQIYCRQAYTDLASIRNSDEHQRVSDLVKFVRYVWIGLFLDVWEWSDQGNSSFRYWAVTQPLNLLKSDCVVMVMGIFGKWHDTMCDRQLPFVCYKAGKKQIVRVKVSADGKKDLNSYSERSIILKQIQQKLRGQGMTVFAKLSWRRKSGVFFQPEKNKPVEKNNTRLCDEL